MFLRRGRSTPLAFECTRWSFFVSFSTQSPPLRYNKTSVVNALFRFARRETGALSARRRFSETRIGRSDSVRGVALLPLGWWWCWCEARCCFEKFIRFFRASLKVVVGVVVSSSSFASFSSSFVERQTECACGNPRASRTAVALRSVLSFPSLRFTRDRGPKDEREREKIETFE